MKICENCKKEHNGTYGSGRFCSNKCARGFSTKAKRKEINETVRKKLSAKGHKDVKKICEWCKKNYEISWDKRQQRFCSLSCSAMYRNSIRIVSDETKQRMSNATLKAYKNGKKVYGGTTKWIDYDGIKIQGNFELRTCKILDIWKQYNVIKDWEYTNDRVQYIDNNGKKRTYLLDFKVYTNEGLNYYIEVKGYEKPNDLLKWKAVREAGNKLEVWFEKDIAKIENGGCNR